MRAHGDLLQINSAGRAAVAQGDGWEILNVLLLKPAASDFARGFVGRTAAGRRFFFVMASSSKSAQFRRPPGMRMRYKWRILRELRRPIERAKLGQTRPSSAKLGQTWPDSARLGQTGPGGIERPAGQDFRRCHNPSARPAPASSVFGLPVSGPRCYNAALVPIRRPCGAGRKSIQ